MTTWTRVWGNDAEGGIHNRTLATIPAGHTVLRIHAGFWMGVRVPALYDPSVLANFVTGIGIYTVNAVGGTLISPLTTPADTAPPSQRWLYWVVLPLAPSGDGGWEGESWRLWSLPGGQHRIDVEAMVAARTQDLAVQLAWESPTEVLPEWLGVSVWWSSCLVS